MAQLAVAVCFIKACIDFGAHLAVAVCFIKAFGNIGVAVLVFFLGFGFFGFRVVWNICC